MSNDNVNNYMQQQNPYRVFDTYILRTPILPLDFFYELTNSSITSDTFLKKIFEDPLIKESIYIASPEFYRELNKNDSKGKEKLYITLFKYLTRMSSRCTPFGTFAGCNVGGMTNKKNNIIIDSTGHRKHTRLDLKYLIDLCENINYSLFHKLKFHSNTSIYRVGDRIRYIEYIYTEDKIRNHQIVEIVNSQYIDLILELTQNGCYFEELCHSLIDSEIDYEEAKAFVIELIENQIIKSELDISISGDPFMGQLISTLNKAEKESSRLKIIKNIIHQIDDLDSVFGASINKYEKISKTLGELKTPFKEKFLFQVDTNIATKVNVLNDSIKEDILRAFNFLNSISNYFNPNLEEFKKRFINRYETQEVPLSKAIDVELGIGYLQSNRTSDINPLVDDLKIPNTEESDIKTYTLTKFQIKLQQKLIDAVTQSKKVIQLNDNDIEVDEYKWHDIPDTISTISNITKLNDQLHIIIKGFLGTSATSLIGRFCNENEEIYQFAKKVIEIENRSNPEKVLAEIIHLPESRHGNVLIRPSFREYEIPYLGKSTKDADHTLQVEDLYISVRNENIVLKSKKLNKEILPRLSNAHNYSNNSLPIYQFLCDLQKQNLRTHLMFNWGPLSDFHDFLPRVQYKNIIFSEAIWNVKKEEIKHLFKTTDDRLLLKEIDNWRVKRKLPQYVIFPERDHALLINLKNINSIKVLFNFAKKKNDFKLIEYLFNKEYDIIKDENGKVYTNEFIFSLFNSKKLNL